jgi:hypothetical protein
MEPFIKNNLSLIREAFPSVYQKISNISRTQKYTVAGEKDPNIFFGKRAYHSIHNPRGEALNLVKDLHAEPGIIFIFLGIGFGYHIEKFKALYKNVIPGITVVCIERSAQAFDLLLRHRDISFLKGVHLFVGDAFEEIENFFSELTPLSFRGYRIIRLRGGFSLFKKYYSNIESLFRSFMSGMLSDLLTRFAFESLWMKNIIDAVPHIIGKRSIDALKGALKKKPALVLGAGPSLSSQLEKIEKLYKSVYIIAVDTALEPLLTVGIAPDLVVTLDAQFYNTLDFHYSFIKASDTTGSILVADLMAYPKIIRLWGGPLYFSKTSTNDGTNHDSHPLISVLEESFGSIGDLRCGGSVATSAIDLALHLGASPILLAGCDFAYTGYATHVSSSSPYILFYKQSNHFNTIATSMTREIASRKHSYIEGMGNKKVLSDFIFRKYLGWINARNEYKNLVYNATARGALIPGMEKQNLDKIIRQASEETKRDKQPILPLNTNTFSAEMALNFLNSLNTQIKQARQDLQKVTDEGFTASRYPFLQNSFHIAKKLYTDKKSLHQHLSLLLVLLEKRVKIAAGKIQNR